LLKETGSQEPEVILLPSSIGFRLRSYFDPEDGSYIFL
jgi:hypothetical protein